MVRAFRSRTGEPRTLRGELPQMMTLPALTCLIQQCQNPCHIEADWPCDLVRPTAGARMEDTIYLLRRAEDERLAAKGATSEEARLCHLELAAAYELRAHRLKVQQRRAEMRIVSAA